MLLQTRSKLTPATVILFTFLYLLICYAPGLHEQFFLIDDASLINIPQIAATFDFNLLKTWFTPGTHIDFYPLRDFSYWLDVHLLGANIAGADAIVFRLQNFIWILGSVFLIFYLLKYFKLQPLPASMIASLWLLHPVHSELLMWPSARKDCMALFFGLFAVYSYLRHINERGIRWGILCISAFLLGLLSKASLVTLPLIIPLYGFLFRDSKCWQRRHIVVWFTALILGILAALVQQFIYSQITDMRFHYTPSYRIQSALAALGRMSAGLLIPKLNGVDVENWGNWAQMNASFIPVGIAFLGVCIFLTVTSIWHRKRMQFLALTLFWLGYLPISSLIFAHRNFYSVRYFELPALALGFGIVLKFFKKESCISNIVLTSCLALSLIGTYSEAKNWEDGLQPFVKALKLTPENPSLLRMEYHVLRNQELMSRLNEEMASLKKATAHKLENTCGVSAKNDDLNNAHLCLNIWTDVLLNHLKLHMPRELPIWVQSAFSYVNSDLGSRIQQRLLLQRKLRGDKISLSNNYQELNYFRAYPSSSPLRMEYWLILCLKGEEQKARFLLIQWMTSHLINRQSVGEFFSDFNRKYPNEISRISNCFLKKNESL